MLRGDGVTGRKHATRTGGRRRALCLNGWDFPPSLAKQHSPVAQRPVLGDVPVVNGQLLDLVALLGAITKRGGVRRVQDQSLWNEVWWVRRSADGGQPRQPSRGVFLAQHSRRQPTPAVYPTYDRTLPPPPSRGFLTVNFSVKGRRTAHTHDSGLGNERAAHKSSISRR